MDSERWRQIDQLFHSALERAPGARAAFLAQACESDESLQREVESLIESHKQSDSFIEAPATDIAADLMSRRETGLRAGESVGPYRIISTLGEGGMGEVYLAQDVRLGRQVALKRLPDEFNLDPDRVRRFEQEARAVSALNHPNIVTIYEIARVNFPFITTEFIDGGTLRQHLSGARMKLDEVLGVAIQIASALAAAHAAGLVHRDIKPENIMIRPDGYVKVLDFGLAKLVEDKNKSFLGLEDSTAKHQTASGVILGTVHYMSPEQAKGERVDERTDIFSLGAVIYEMIAGETPFAGGSKSETFANLINQEPQPLSLVVPNVPQALQSIVFKTLCKNRDNRYHTINDLLVDLKDLREKLTLSERFNKLQLHENGEATASLPATANNWDEPVLIETIKRRGFGFSAGEQRVETNEENSVITNGAVVALADWRQETDENQAANSASISATEQSNAKTGQLELVPATSVVTNRRNNYFYPLAGLILVAGLLVSAVSLSSWFRRSKSLEAGAPVLSAAFRSEELLSNGQFVTAVISPDGKNVIYTNGATGKQSVWLRQLKSSTNVEVIPASDDIYGGLAFSPDGNFFYFTRKPLKGLFDIYRVSISGGIPTKIVNDVMGAIGVSRGVEKISFVRCDYLTDKSYSLWIAETDGSNEKKLVSRLPPLRITSPQPSADGKTVAFGAGQSKNAENGFGLFEVDIESGVERELTPQKFFNITSVAWLPKQSGWLLAAAIVPNKHFLIWQVSATGEAFQLTGDSENYSALSLDNAASLIVARQTKLDFNIILHNMKNPAEQRVLVSATDVGFALNGKIVFAARISGNTEIWGINADGSEQRQLTNDAADDSHPIFSRDSNSIFFVSNRTGKAQVWRMNADGSSQTQITFKEGGIPLFASPEGKWIYYHHGLQRTLWRVSTTGGDTEELVLNKEKYYFAFSPDGSQVAFAETPSKERTIAIVSLADGRTLNTIKAADQQSAMTEPEWLAEQLWLTELEWLPDGKGLAYVEIDSEFDKQLWVHSFFSETSKKIVDLGDRRISSLALSPDGKTFAVAQGTWKNNLFLIKGLK